MSEVENLRQNQLVTIFRQNILLVQQQNRMTKKKRSNLFEINSKSYFKSEAFDEFQEREFKLLMSYSQKLMKKRNGNGEKLNIFLSELVDFMDPDEHAESREVLEIGLTIFNQYVTSGESENLDDQDEAEATSKMDLTKK